MNKTTNTLIAFGISIVVILGSLFMLGTSIAGALGGNAPKQEATQQKDQKKKEKEASDSKKDADKKADTKEEATTEEGDAKEAEEESSERTAFVNTWAERIDAFNAGYPLAGYGKVFAEAAYDAGVDPRLSPAIARVESTSGQYCMYDFNAWGWGESSWTDWDTAIRAHVTGLAEQFGKSLTMDMAEAYNGDNVQEWYDVVGSVETQIWETDSL